MGIEIGFFVDLESHFESVFFALLAIDYDGHESGNESGIESVFCCRNRG